jgi:hypothetical protein
MRIYNTTGFVRMLQLCSIELRRRTRDYVHSLQIQLLLLGLGSCFASLLPACPPLLLRTILILVFHSAIVNPGGAAWFFTFRRFFKHSMTVAMTIVSTTRAAPTPMPTFTPVLSPGASGVAPLVSFLVPFPALLDSTTPIFFAKDVAYSGGNEPRSLICHAITIGSATARPVDSMVVLFSLDVAYDLAKVSQVDMVSSYEVVADAPLAVVVVRRAKACRGVEKVLIQAYLNSGPKVIPLIPPISVYTIRPTRAHKERTFCSNWLAKMSDNPWMH